MADGQHTALARVQVLLEFLNEREMDAEDLAEIRRVRLEQAAQLVQLQADATHVANWIRNGEAMLLASLRVPENLQDADQLRSEHEQFQVAIEKTHTSAVQVKSLFFFCNVSKVQLALKHIFHFKPIFFILISGQVQS